MIVRMGSSSLTRRLLSPSWWLRDPDGRVVIAQWPNVALWVWLVTVVAQWWHLSAHREHVLSEVGHGALIVWAGDELLRGVNPARRLLGLVVLVLEIRAVVSA